MAKRSKPTNTTVFSDSKHGTVHLLAPPVDGNPVQYHLISGLAKVGEKVTSRDGFSKTCTHAQPHALCVEGRSVFVCDRASNRIRIISNITTLLSYHQSIQKLYHAFTIHSYKLGNRTPIPVADVSRFLCEVCELYDSMRSGVREAHGNTQLKANEPQGCLPYVTIEMFHQLQTNFDNLRATVHSLSSTYEIHPLALLSIPCEHHFAQMRARYQMPSLLQYCDLLSTVIDETVKRSTISGYRYYTGKKSYYPRPELQTPALLPGTKGQRTLEVAI